MARTGAYVDREPGPSVVDYIAVQTNVARDVFCANTAIFARWGCMALRELVKLTTKCGLWNFGIQNCSKIRPRKTFFDIHWHSISKHHTLDTLGRDKLG